MRNSKSLSSAACVLAVTGWLAGCATPAPDGKAADGIKAAAAPGAPAATPTAASPVATKAVAVASAASGANSASGRPASATGPTPGAPPAFATVIKDARRIEGALTLWQKDDKVWIELTPAQFGKQFLLSPKIKSGISDAFVLGGLMAYPINGAGGPQVVQFQRVHNQVRLQAVNTEVAAMAGTPEARAVADSYSNSLLGATTVASQPHPDRKSVLIEANGLFLSDMMGIGMMLQRGLRQGYGLDRNNSHITAVRGTDDAVVIETQNHFFTGSIATPLPGAPPGAPLPSIPRFLPDARSMLISLHYSIAPLPDLPMATRVADPRIGLFSSTVLDFSNDMSASPRKRFVNRWRLEKKDPAAALSPPVKPITYWIDRNVPLAYRESVRAAILEWNKAFEKIGIQGAIVVEQQADDAKFDTLDFGYASVRWMMNASPSFAAFGPAHFDPRTGEILDADIAFEGMVARGVRTLRSQVLAGNPHSANGASEVPLSFAAPLEWPVGASHATDPRLCMHGALAAEQLGYALDVLQAQGQLEPDSPIAQQFVQDYIKEAVMHEVGHTLGLRHNFRASRAYTEAQLADTEFTRANGTTGSVMEYNAVNLPSPGKPGGMPFHTALGPYDYWAIEYAYKPMAPGTSAKDEQSVLQSIAARSHEPLLAFGTDEDAAFGIDPETIQLDLGADPVAFATKRLAIARDLFMRQESRALSPLQDYAVLRRSIDFALADVTRAVGVLVRQIGGVRTLRDFPGSGREPLLPVPAAVQRQALDLIASAVLSPQGLSLSPALQRRLAPDYLDRAEGAFIGTDYSLTQRLLDLQRAVLAYLMSDTVAARILDSVGKFDRPAEAFKLGEIHSRLRTDLWGDVNVPVATDPARRELQRDHVNRLAAAVLRPMPGSRVDTRSQVRTQTRALLTHLEAAMRQRALTDADTRAHLADCADTLRQALAAPLQRLGL